MIDLITATVMAPCDIIHQACQDVMVRSPEGFVAQYYYVTAKVYRCVRNVMNSLPPLCNQHCQEDIDGQGRRISIAAIKAEVEEMVRMSYQNLDERCSSMAHGSSDAYMADDELDKMDLCDGREDTHFRHIRYSDLETIKKNEEGHQPMVEDDLVASDMEDFIEMMMSCAKEVELQC